MKRPNWVITLFFVLSISVVAQENSTSKNRRVQVTFAYPIGSSGLSSMDYSNNFSFNILYGLNGGVKGVEIGSILNYNKGSVEGFQLSGVANINTRYSKGFLLSGVTNICSDSADGMLISGVLNYTKKDTRGFQLSTTNITGNELEGFQLGVLNYAKRLEGFQMGVLNYANRLEGFQIGVLNYAKSLKGFQLGVLNIIGNGEEALPIGVFNFVKNGLFELELTGGEVIYSNLTYKMGVDKFYTLYKAGLSTFKNNPVYSYGLGWGSTLSLSEN